MEIARNMSEEDWSYMLSLPLYLRVPHHNVIVVHAGLVPGVELESQVLVYKAVYEPRFFCHIFLGVTTY